MIFFSIVIPTYNRADFISKTINSCLNQSYTHFEVIVVDDGSTDNTEEIVKAITDTRVNYYKKKNGERGAARNYGVKMSSGNYVTFLDSDDLLYENYLCEANKLIEDQKINLFFQLFETKDEEGNLINPSEKITKNISKNLIFKGNFIACQGVFIKREIILTNLFIENRDLSGSEDYELWLRLSCQFNLVCNPVITSALIEHKNRSVQNFSSIKLIKRKNLMLKYLFESDSTNRAYRKYKSPLLSGAYSYIALHIALSKTDKLIAIKYLIKSILAYPSIIFKKRFFAIVKHLVF